MKKLLIIAGIILSFIAFYFATWNIPRYSAPKAINCSDVSGMYEPCARKTQRFGIPFAYAEGYGIIPGPDDVYVSRSETNIAILVADYLIVVGAPAVLIYLIRRQHYKNV